MEITLTYDQLSNICHLYSQGRLDKFDMDSMCRHYREWLEDNFGSSWDICSQITGIDFLEYECSPMFYLNMVQFQDQIEDFLQHLKRRSEEYLFELFQEVADEYEISDIASLYDVFCHEYSIDSLEREDFITSMMKKFSEKNFAV